MSKSVKERFRIRLNPDGTLNPDCIQEAGQVWVKHWLQERLSGFDPYFPIDHRYGGDPEALVAAFLRDMGSGHVSFELISRVVLDLLKSAFSIERKKKAAPWLENTLRLCQQVVLPMTKDWFVNQLKSLSENPAQYEKSHGGYEISKEILYAAIRQAPGIEGSSTRVCWERLLDETKYASLALAGLFLDFPGKLTYLKRWWKAGAKTPEQELDYMIYSALRSDPDKEKIRRAIAEAKRQYQYPEDLVEQINKALQSNGINAVSDAIAAWCRRTSKSFDALRKAGHQTQFHNFAQAF
ncbi:MAG: hypothetical protein NTX50_30470 [Candidatus Sumerlaeota bacterium]|nr:hypothetical protein [Candidatus Sumerlaeota bacterium]